MKINFEHKDKLGRLINVDDIVVFPSSNHLGIGKVKKINPKMIGIFEFCGSKFRSYSINKYPHDVVKIEGPDISMFILQNSSK